MVGLVFIIKAAEISIVSLSCVRLFKKTIVYVSVHGFFFHSNKKFLFSNTIFWKMFLLINDYEEKSETKMQNE